MPGAFFRSENPKTPRLRQIPAPVEAALTTVETRLVLRDSLSVSLSLLFGFAIIKYFRDQMQVYRERKPVYESLHRRRRSRRAQQRHNARLFESHQ